MIKSFLYAVVIFLLFPNIAIASPNKHNNLSNLSTRYIAVIDYESGRLLYGKNELKVVPMASTTKIMTAIVALENSNLNDIVTISKNASSIHGSTIGLKYGQKLTMEQLLYGLMLRSGNDCAIAIAEHVGGSVERFSDMMNSKAFDIGAFNTHFTTPHGLDSDGHFTTAYDLALITRYAFTNGTFCKIAASKDAIINGANSSMNFHNINKILWQVEGADGVKTGYTGKAGKCLVSSASQNNRRVICVALNSEDRWDDSKKLLEYGLNTFKYKEVLKKEDYLIYAKINNGNKPSIKAGIVDDISIPVSEEEKGKVTIEAVISNNLEAPVSINQQVGKIIVYINNKYLCSIPIKAVESIRKSPTKSWINSFFNNNGQ